jgi:hypothetical protein
LRAEIDSEAHRYLLGEYLVRILDESGYWVVEKIHEWKEKVPT